jgi:DNA-binding LacI/PurR family transcriptional regulator
MTTRDNQRRLQMADIARLAGVSIATVSRALNGSPLINAATRERITALAQSHDYTINLGAKNLRMQRNQTIAVVIPYDATSRQHISDPFFLSMLGSLADAVTDRGYDLLLSRVDADNLDAAARLYHSGVALGVVLIGQWHHHDQLNQMAARKVPIVVWGAQLPQQLYCTVGGDNVLGGRLAAEHLLKQGRKRILFMGDPRLPEVAQRQEGFRQALRAAHVSESKDLQLVVPFDVDVARAALTKLLSRRLGFDAVFGCSDLLAITAMQVLRERGHRVPQDVAVVGYDNMALAGYCDPPLTSVHQPVQEAGAAMVDALLAMLQGHQAAPRVLPVSLVARPSSAASGATAT